MKHHWGGSRGDEDVQQHALSAALDCCLILAGEFARAAQEDLEPAELA
eukprot:CAMPEP_0181340286 /NCGR_PEP_ID=MMETSP1101-20121128/29755_1 /TAXON_ID=46948 /ORGANISM="Rhodomonas abbreviata, Strain Caron Lab Isolate" /LENGTH=47 /DNA_ID= /DNA_START= /DNA_END= /DNA_ORIENTATION=